jgi:Tfp pilus assembly protein PilF
MNLRSERPSKRPGRGRRLLLALPALALVLAPGAALLQAQGNDAEARFNIALMHMREGRLDAAIEEFKKAVKQEPSNPFFLKGLGQAYAQKRKYKEAIESFRKALQANPYYVDVRNDLGMALMLSGDRDEGKKEFLTAYGDPTNPTPEFSALNLGRAWMDEKNYAEALNWFRTTVNRNKGMPDGYIGMADVYYNLGKVDEAIAQLEAGLKEIPNDASLQVALGEACYKVGRFSDAKSHLEEAARQDGAGPYGRRAQQLLQGLPK